MSNKFKIGDEVVIDLESVNSPAMRGLYNGKSGVVKALHKGVSDYYYEIHFWNGEIYNLLEDELRLKNNPKITEEESLRETLLQNKELLLNNRKAIDKSLELIEIMLNK